MTDVPKPLPSVEETALLVTDVQYDFLPDGALPAAGADIVLGPIARLMRSDRFALVVGTQDWHPAGHISFASSHTGKAPMDVIELYGHEQTLWPDHCVQGSHGAELYPGLPWTRASAIIRKGEDPICDSYSAFRNNWDREGLRPPTGLAGYLGERGIRAVVVCGLTRDVCAKWTAEDGADAGFSVWYVWDATAPVDAGNDDAVRRSMGEHGIPVVNTSDLL